LLFGSILCLCTSCQFPDPGGIKDTILGDLLDKSNNPLLIGILGGGREQPDLDAFSPDFLRHCNDLPPVHIEQGCVKPVLIKFHSSVLEEQVDLPWPECRVRDGAQICRNGEFFLPTILVVDDNEQERHNKYRCLSQVLEEPRDPVRQVVPEVSPRGASRKIRYFAPEARDLAEAA